MWQRRLRFLQGMRAGGLCPMGWIQREWTQTVKNCSLQEEEGGWGLTLRRQGGRREEMSDSRVLSNPRQLGAGIRVKPGLILGGQDMGHGQVGSCPCPPCPAQPLSLDLSLPSLYEPGLCWVSPRILRQQSWFSHHQPVSLSHSGTSTSGARGEGASLPGASLKSSLSSFGGPLSAVSLQGLSCSAGPERGSCLLRGYKACLEGEKLFPQVCSYWGSHEGGIFNPLLFFCKVFCL